MRRFKLKDGEQAISEHNVALAFEGKARLARLILTSDRLVIAMTYRRPGDWIGLLWRYVAPKGLLRVAYEMRRDRFVSVEPGDGGILVFHDSGEGYAHVSFTLTPDLLAAELEPLAVWQQRMRAWTSGMDEGVPLPTATLVDT
jgi:hypothetical protein